MTLAVVVLYLVAVVGIGVAARLGAGGAPDRAGEGYFLAGRSIGPFVLLMTLFGTNMTAFTILGASGEAYRQGVRVFALMATSSAIVIPMTFLLIGVPLWRLGKRHGFATQAEFFEARYGSPALGVLVLGASLLWLVPYVLIGVKGGGDALAAIVDTDAAIPPWAGSLVMCLVVLVYVVLGGMRSTAMVNTFQTLVFIAVSGLAFLVITGGMGGFGPAMARLGERSPELLELARSPRDWIQIATYLFVPLSTSCFPHIFSHWMSARSAEAFRLPVLAYPACIAAVWFPSVVLGALGRLDVPLDAAGPVIILLIREHAGSLLAGALAAGVFAAIMSSLDSQTLAVGTMLTKNAAARVPAVRGVEPGSPGPARPDLRGRVPDPGVRPQPRLHPDDLQPGDLGALGLFDVLPGARRRALLEAEHRGGRRRGHPERPAPLDLVLRLVRGRSGLDHRRDRRGTGRRDRPRLRPRPRGGLPPHRPTGPQPPTHLLRLTRAARRRLATPASGPPRAALRAAPVATLPAHAAPRAWNAGLQTGTRSAPRCARRNPNPQGAAPTSAPNPTAPATHRPATPASRPPRAALRTAPVATPPAWNAGLQTGTRSAPRCARRNPTRKGRLPPRHRTQQHRRRTRPATPASRPPRAALRTAPVATPPAWNAGLQTGTRSAPRCARRNPTRKGRLPPRHRTQQHRRRTRPATPVSRPAREPQLRRRPRAARPGWRRPPASLP